MSEFAVVNRQSCSATHRDSRMGNLRDPREIAAEINAIKRTTATYILSQSIWIGKLLCEAKETVPHGEWGSWLADNCDYSQSNANNLMRIYQEYGEQDQLDFFAENKLELFGNLTRSQAVALLALPKHERAGFVQENDVESMSTREFEKAVAEAKEKIEAEAAAKLAEKLEEAEADYAAEIQRVKDQAQSDVDKAMEAADIAEAKAKEDRKEYDKMMADALRAKTDMETAVKDRERMGDLLKQKSEEADTKDREIRELKRKLEEAEADRLVEEAVEKRMAENASAAGAEIDALRAENEKLKKAADPVVQKFSALFGAWQEDWNRMRKVLTECTDSQTSEKLKAALGQTLEVMKGQV